MNDELEKKLTVAVRELAVHELNASPGDGARNIYRDIMSSVKKELAHIALYSSNGNRSRAARKLGINRGTFRKILVENKNEKRQVAKTSGEKY